MVAKVFQLAVATFTGLQQAARFKTVFYVARKYCEERISLVHTSYLLSRHQHCILQTGVIGAVFFK